MSKRSRRRARQGVAAGAAAPAASAAEPVDPYAAFADREWNFFFLPDEPAHVVDEGQLRGLMKDWRHGRATRTIGDVISDGYYAIFAVILVGAMVTNLVLSQSRTVAGCTSAACVSGRSLLPWAVLFGACALAFAVSRLMGPVMVSSAEGVWLMEAPISRGRLLRGRLWLAVAGAFLLAGLIGGLVALLSGLAPMAAAGWALAAGAGASAAVAFGAVEQSHDRTLPVRVLQIVSGVLAGAALVTMVAISTGWLAAPAGTLFAELPWILAGLGAAAVIVAGVVAQRRLSHIRRSRLTSGGSLVSGMQGAMFALDLGLARDILVEREAADRGHVRPTKGRGLGLQALVWRDVQRLLRFPKPFAGLVGALLVPYAVDALGLGIVMPFLSALALFMALVPFLGGLRVLSRTQGLARTLPFSTSAIRSASMVVPAILAVLWSIAILPAALGLGGGTPRSWPDAAMVALAIGAAGLLGAVRWQTAKPVDFGVPMMATASGAMPPTLMFNLVRGFDTVALVTAPVMLGVAPYWSLALAGVVFMFLRMGGMNMEDVQAQANEDRKRLAEERAQRNRPAQKVRIQRPQR